MVDPQPPIPRASAFSSRLRQEERRQAIHLASKMLKGFILHNLSTRLPKASTTSHERDKREDSLVMKALVTGAAGFIGSHLVDRLLQEGCEVLGLDSLLSGRLENLKHLERRADFRLLHADLCDPQAYQQEIQGCDWVFHLAGQADIVPSIREPASYFRNNVEATLRLLEALRTRPPRKFVYAASSSCYGIPDEYPTPESAPIRPQYPYALTKRMGEELVLHWDQVYALPTLSLRLFNVFGPRSRTSGAYGAVFGVFLAQKLAGKPFTVVGDGSQSRDFTFVSDVVEAFVKAARTPLRGRALNVGSGGHYSVNRLVELLGGERISIPRRPGEPDITFADTRAIGDLLGWKAAVPFEEGVALLLQSLEAWREAPVWTPESIAESTKEWFRHLGGS